MWITGFTGHKGSLAIVETTQLGFLPKVHFELHRKKIQERLAYAINNQYLARQEELVEYAHQHSDLQQWQGEEGLPEAQVTVSWIPGLVQKDGKRGPKTKVLGVSVPRHLRSIYRRIIYDACAYIDMEYTDFSLKYDNQEVYNKSVRDHQEYMHFHKHIHIHGLQRDELCQIEDALEAVPSVVAVDDTVITDRNGTFVLILKHPFAVEDLATIDKIIRDTPLSRDREFRFLPYRKKQDI